MGNLAQFCCCSNNNDNNNKSPKTFKNTSINLNEMENDGQSSNEYSEDYEYLTPEEMGKIKEKMDYKLQNYQKMPLKASSINYIYESGIIE